MSAPAFESKVADYIGQGFLAIKAKNALKAILGGKTLTVQEREVLLKAEKFLKEIASGASLVSTGEARGIKPMDSMIALDYAMDPIEHLRDLLGNREVSDFFNDLANSVGQSAQGDAKAQSAGEPMLNFAVSFFDALYLSLSNVLDRNYYPLGGNLEHAHPLA